MVSAHTVIELPAPSYRHDYEGNIVSTDWEVQPPPGFDDAVDEHSCAAGAECCSYVPDDYRPRPASVGAYLTGHEDTYGAEQEYVTWNAWLVDGRWVVCEDCAGAIECGDLGVTPDGVWTWKPEAQS